MATLICDLDGTLILGNLEYAFMQYTLQRGALGPRSFLLAPITNIVNTIRRLFDKGMVLRAWPASINSDSLDELVNDFLTSSFCPQIDSDVLHFVEQFEGEKILLTGSDEMLARAYLNAQCPPQLFNRIIGLTGKGPIVERHPYGKAKVDLLPKSVHLIGIGNEYVDRFFLKRCDSAYVHNPDKKLREYAEIRGWREI